MAVLSINEKSKSILIHIVGVFLPVICFIALAFLDLKIQDHIGRILLGWIVAGAVIRLACLGIELIKGVFDCLKWLKMTLIYLVIWTLLLILIFFFSANTSYADKDGSGAFLCMLASIYLYPSIFLLIRRTTLKRESVCVILPLLSGFLFEIVYLIGNA